MSSETKNCLNNGRAEMNFINLTFFKLNAKKNLKLPSVNMKAEWTQRETWCFMLKSSFSVRDNLEI